METMSDREVFRKNFNNLMNETKTKQIDIARYAEVSYQTVSAWATGRGYPRADKMSKICQFFGVKPSVLTDSARSVNPMEDELIDAFRSLPDAGREKLIERARELLKLYPQRRRKSYAESEEEV